MTMKKLAALANVSKSTVSKAFSGAKDINPETREHIFKIAKETGCYDKYNKKPFDKKVVAIICPEINSADYSAIVNLLIHFLEEQNAIALLSSTSFDEDKEKEFYRYYNTYCKADGVIIINTLGVYSGAEVMIPTVSMFAKHDSKLIDNVDFTSVEAMRNIISTLKALGHKKIGFAGEPLTTGMMTLFRDTAREFAISLSDSSLKISDKRFEEAGKDSVRQWLAEGTLPTAIIAAYSYIALGIINELKENGIKVPEEVSVVGINDTAFSSFVVPPLSSIKYPNEELCREAVSLLLKKIDNQHYRARHTTNIPARFIVRESIGPAKK